VALETRIVECHRLTREQRIAALAAAGILFETGSGNAIDGAAVRTDEMFEFGHGKVGQATV
jgi:hypothetical protein